MKEFNLKPNGAEEGKIIKFPIQKVVVEQDEETGKNILLLTLDSKHKINGENIFMKLEAIQMAVNVGNEVPESEQYAVTELSNQQLKITGYLQLAVTNLKKFKLLHFEDEGEINRYLDSLDAEPMAKSRRIIPSSS